MSMPRPLLFPPVPSSTIAKWCCPIQPGPLSGNHCKTITSYPNVTLLIIPGVPPTHQTSHLLLYSTLWLFLSAISFTTTFWDQHFVFNVKIPCFASGTPEYSEYCPSNLPQRKLTSAIKDSLFYLGTLGLLIEIGSDWYRRGDIVNFFPPRPPPGGAERGRN